LIKTVRHIVVGIDFSEPSLAAVRWTARHLAGDAELVLAHAVCIPEPPGFLRGLYAPTEPLVEAARRGARDRLKELADELELRNMRFEVRVGRSPDHALSSLAEEQEADLLVIGPHGERAGIWRLLGSTAERVIRRAPCSVLLARGLPAEGIKTLAVALDESEITGAVIQWVELLAGTFQARVVVIHVVHRFLHGPTTIAASPTERQRAEEQLRRQAEQWCIGQIPIAAGERGEVDVTFGDTALAILSAVERHRADLLVMGRHGARRGSGGFLGSVAEFLLRNGSCPVLAVAGAPDSGR
jgi:nucleotide-binding universal stress UspA family protein